MIVKLRRLNVGLDHLSRIENGEENMDEGFPDMHLFAIRIANEHFTDIIQFLSTGIAPEGYTTQKGRN